jgi:predicted DNA-binding antitoxin AbrB/MazE fold protein
LVRIVEAIYEKGVLKLLEKTDLRDGERVKVVILRGSRGLSDAVKRISKEYRGVREDPLKILLEGRR